MSVGSSSTQSDHDETSKYQDLFHEQAPLQDGKNVKPWWKTQFFVIEPALFGTWEGVFTSCLINIFGVVLFLRTGWMVGNVGIGLSMLIVFMTVTVSLLAALSAIGLFEQLRGMETGGVYYIVSRALGGKIGGTVGVMYAFGLCIVSSLYCTGFAESVTQTFNWDNIWAVRGVAIGTLLLLLIINLAGVKWVIRLQLLLLLILFISTCDFIIGTFVHSDPEAGFVGYSSEVMRNNSYISLQPGETFFTVFGVFFPTATGIMAGVNMSGDLKNPARSIPIGTLSAISISFFLYIVFVLLLGSTCLREALQVDFMIAEKVSAVGVLWLLGVYMSSTSSCSTGLYGAPRVLQSIANENVIPILKFLGKGFGPNKTPVIAICIVGVVALIFILIGNLNVISPVITCNFMLVYAIVDYSYFALSMSYDLQIKNFTKFKTPKNHRKTNASGSTPNGFDLSQEHPNHYGSTLERGTMDEFTKDLNHLFNKSSNKGISKGSLRKRKIDKSGKECLQESFALQTDTTHSPPIDTTYSPPTDTTYSLPIDTTYSPPSDTTHSPPIDTTYSPPTDTTYSLPIDTTYSPPSDTTHSPPTDTTYSPPTDTTQLKNAVTTTLDESTFNNQPDNIEMTAMLPEENIQPQEEVSDEIVTSNDAIVTTSIVSGDGVRLIDDVSKEENEVTREREGSLKYLLGCMSFTVGQNPIQPLNEIDEILKQPKSCYSPFCNRWLSLFGAFLTIIVMFLINWIYALANITAFLLIFLYTSLSNPGLPPGVTVSFSFIGWIKEIGRSTCCREKERLPEQYIVTPIVSSSCSVVSTVLTKDNEDFANRGRFHQSAVGDYDYASLVADSRSDGILSDRSSDGFGSDRTR